MKFRSLKIGFWSKAQILVTMFLLILAILGCHASLNAYYGLYGTGMYGSLRTYGLLGGLYSGMYGMGSLYGGMGGLYGISGFNRSLYNPLGSLGGLSGGLYGLYGMGMYGLGGLYGMGGLFGGFGGLSNSIGTLGMMYGLGILNNPLQKAQPAVHLLTAEQAGTWTGTWISLIKLNAGIMNLTLVEDALAGVLSGEANLILNKITNSIPANVSGPFTGGTTFILTGSNQLLLSTTLLLTTAISLYSIELDCTLTSPTTMTGTYMIQDLIKLGIDYGNFNLTLTTPVI